MKIAILTSSDNIYANYILKNLIKKGCFGDDEIVVLEQDWIMARKNKIRSIIKYCELSGYYYTFAQIFKQTLFAIVKNFIFIAKNETNYYYPYYKLRGDNIKKRKLVNLHLPKTYDNISKINPDVIISIFSKEIIPKEIFNFPKLGCFNLHPSPLPRYGGVSPTFWCLALGEKEMWGTTLHRVNKGIDRGEIIGQKKFLLDGFCTEHSLYQQCARVGCEILEDFLKILKRKEHIYAWQSEEIKSYHSFPKKEYVSLFKQRGHSFFKIKEFLN